MKIPIAFLLLVAPLACAAEESPSIAPDELAARIAAGDGPFVLDVRTAEEFAGGHVPGAVNIPHTELPERLAELDLPKSSELVVHCESGRRAAMAEDVLAEAGFSNVRDLTGHMRGWRDAGLPLE